MDSDITKERNKKKKNKTKQKKTWFERENKTHFGTEIFPPPILWFVLEVRFQDDEISDC